MVMSDWLPCVPLSCPHTAVCNLAVNPVANAVGVAMFVVHVALAGSVQGIVVTGPKLALHEAAATGTAPVMYTGPVPAVSAPEICHAVADVSEKKIAENPAPPTGTVYAWK